MKIIIDSVEFLMRCIDHPLAPACVGVFMLATADSYPEGRGALSCAVAYSLVGSSLLRGLNFFHENRAVIEARLEHIPKADISKSLSLVFE